MGCENVNEIAIEWTRNSDFATVSAYNNSKIKNKIMKLAKERPDEVQVIAQNSDGSICAHLPKTFIKISPPKRVSEEQRLAAAKRLEKARNSK